MQVKISSVKISAVSCAVPSDIFDLRSLSSEYGDELVESIIKSTGISTVRVADYNKTSSDYCYEAANSLIEASDLSANQIDGLIFVSQTPDYLIPQTSFILQKRLGIDNKAICFDLRIGCSGFVYGIYLASLLLNSGSCSKVLVLAGDTTTKIIHPKDRSLKMVFGDAGSAALVEHGETDIYFQFNSNGSRFNELIIPAGGGRLPISNETKSEITDKDGNVRNSENLFMDGMAIFNFAIVEVPKLMTSLSIFSGINLNLFQTFGLHQANAFMVNYIAKKMKLPHASVPVLVDGYGNTGPSSIPLLLSILGSERKAAGLLNNSMLVGFGIGLSWAGLVTDLSKTEFIKPVEV